MIDQSIELMYQTMQKPPLVCAHITGSSEIHNMVGDVYLYPFLDGSLLVVDVQGIPFSGFYAFHIHQHGPCIAGEGYTGFHEVGGHYSTTENTPHPYHAGDLPVLMADYGHAFMIVYTDRFKPSDVLGRAMIIHEWPDDYRSQPGGDSGQPIGCGTFYPCEGYLTAQPAPQQEKEPGTQPNTGMPTAPPLAPPSATPPSMPTGPGNQAPNT
jgi:Cu/Zn superoxide dismutase